MDLGVVGLEGVVGSDSVVGVFGNSSLASDPETKHKWYGSGALKQERSAIAASEDDDEWSRTSKVPKTDEISSKAMLFHQRNSLLRSNNNTNASLFSDAHHHQSQMLSFSSPKSETLMLDKASSNATTLPFSYQQLSSYTRNTGYNSGSISMHGALASVRGPFTPSQWMELEHQALIYKYITANVPVPTHLLVPIRKALDSVGFCNFTSGLLRPNALGWGGFHLGFSNNTDPEPGRCRRTDGKKWRCSRDAVVDQKYCERHMNRGRHRSRKPVEGQSGHALTTTTANTTPNASSNPTVVPGNNNNKTTFAHNNVHHPLPPHSSPANTINRMFTSNKENNSTNERIQDGPALLPMLPPTLELKPKENNNPFMIHKHQIPYDESSRTNNEFGLVTSDSLLNPSEKRSFTSSTTSQKDDSESQQQQHSLRHFIDVSPKPHHRSLVWPELDNNMQSDRTQLSISIPISSSDFMSFTTSSPPNEKLTLSPLRLSRELELDPIQMGLGVGSATNEYSNNTRQANWIPITWESSIMGGPLGEVLNLSSTSNNNNASDHHHRCGKNNNNNNTSSSALNLMKDGWDNSPALGSSPTGVLQKTAFGSLSNSSAGSSPRAENNNKEGVTLCNAL